MSDFIEELVHEPNDGDIADIGCLVVVLSAVFSLSAFIYTAWKIFKKGSRR